MTNSICSLTLEDRRLDPAEAEVWIALVPEHGTTGAALRGRFVGPRCPGRTTLELAYPLQSIPGRNDSGTLQARLIIVDPCFWTAESPYSYEGKIELWQDERCCDARSITLRLGKAGSVSS